MFLIRSATSLRGVAETFCLQRQTWFLEKSYLIAAVKNVRRKPSHQAIYFGVALEPMKFGIDRSCFRTLIAYISTLLWT